MNPEKGFVSIIIILIIVVLGIGGIGSILYLQSERNNINKQKQNVSSVTPTSNPLEGWKTYSNPTFPFTFQYPPELIEDGPHKGSDSPIEELKESTLVVTTLASEQKPYRIGIVTGIGKNNTEEENIKFINDYLQLDESAENIKVDGQQAVKIYADLFETKVFHTHIISKDSSIITLSIEWNEEKDKPQREEYDKLIKKVLSTFKFY